MVNPEPAGPLDEQRDASRPALPARPNVILVRYGEIGLKSRSVRNRFERQLVDNLLDQLELEGVVATVERPQGRIVVHAEPVEPAIDPVSRTFGVVSFSPAYHLSTSDRERLKEQAVVLAVPLLKPKGSSTTFGVKVRRTGNHPYTSMELAGEAGAAILQAVPEARVQLKAPQVQVTIEVRQNHSYAMVESLPGVGGLPLGSQGRVAALIDSSASLVAAWLIAKRGCYCQLLLAPGISRELDASLKAFKAWHPGVKSHQLEPCPLSGADAGDTVDAVDVVDAGNAADADEPTRTAEQTSVADDTDAMPEAKEFGEIEQSRVLLHQALVKAHEGRAQALVLGWEVEAIDRLPVEPGMPVFLPLMGLTPIEVQGYLETLLTCRARAIHPLQLPRGSGRRSRA